EMHTTAFWLSFPPAALGGMLPSAVQSGLIGLANLVPQVASLFLMGDPRDLRAVCQAKAPFTKLPTLFLYDNFPGGVGYSQEIYRIYKDIFKAAHKVITVCRCSEGCPSCIGPTYQVGEAGKQCTLQLLEVALK
ncbi:MAG TPA: DUF1998 domain-containing protein, partial [Candidatus Limnocylindrales bacterium]|nr:DUF1998 domain-containing protein [Candidatus Limnocylindrales bacterium]